jgi:hypothetical protein
LNCALHEHCSSANHSVHAVAATRTDLNMNAHSLYQIQFGWCRDADNRVSPLWSEACDVTSPLFGTRSLIIDPKTKELRLPDGSESVDAFQVRS